MPTCRQTSTTVVPSSVSRKAARICFSVCLCHRQVLLVCEDAHVAGPFLKLLLAYFSGFGSPLRASGSQYCRFEVAVATMIEGKSI